MHSDMLPLAPFSDSNPLVHLVGLPALHGACILLGLAGAVVLAFTWAQNEP